MLTQEILKREMDYREGHLWWKVPGPGRRWDGPAGSLDSEGYVRIKVFGQSYGEHRLVWLYHKGEWPPGQLDHINLKPADNRIENLREATNRDNNLNKAQSVRVLPHNIYIHSKGYRVDILYKGTRYKSKVCKTLEDALDRRKELLEKAGLT